MEKDLSISWQVSSVKNPHPHLMSPQARYCSLIYQIETIHKRALCWLLIALDQLSLPREIFLLHSEANFAGSGGISLSSEGRIPKGKEYQQSCLSCPHSIVSPAAPVSVEWGGPRGAELSANPSLERDCHAGTLWWPKKLLWHSPKTQKGFSSMWSQLISEL